MTSRNKSDILLIYGFKKDTAKVYGAGSADRDEREGEARE